MNSFISNVYVCYILVQGQVHINVGYSEDNEAGSSSDTKHQCVNDYYNVVRRGTNISELRNLILNNTENDTFQQEFSVSNHEILIFVGHQFSSFSWIP